MELKDFLPSFNISSDVTTAYGNVEKYNLVLTNDSKELSNNGLIAGLGVLATKIPKEDDQSNQLSRSSILAEATYSHRLEASDTIMVAYDTKAVSNGKPVAIFAGHKEIDGQFVIDRLIGAGDTGGHAKYLDKRQEFNVNTSDGKIIELPADFVKNELDVFIAKHGAHKQQPPAEEIPPHVKEKAEQAMLEKGGSGDTVPFVRRDDERGQSRA